jgi:hypothetical protein
VEKQERKPGVQEIVILKYCYGGIIHDRYRQKTTIQ